MEIGAVVRRRRTRAPSAPRPERGPAVMKPAMIIAVVAALVLAVAPAGQADNARVTRATLASGIFDGTNLYPATCDETQVINDNARTETLNCTFDDGGP